MTVQSSSLNKKFNLDTPVTQLITLNWEIILYIAIFIVAIATRFYDLGTRVMSHDESLHTLYSWNLYAGKGYQHDPLMHGPFLFHITALIYFLFGDNDFTARISTALFGVILVMMPYGFRPWLGRMGALAASVMLLISPGIMFYSRYIRHDIFNSVFTVLMFLAFFQFMRTRGTRWLYIGAVSVALMLSTKEISYIHGFVGVSFIGLGFIWENMSASRKRLIDYIILGLLVVLIGAATYLIVNVEALTTPPIEGQEGSGSDPWDYIELLILAIGLLAGWLLIQLGVDRINKPVTLFLRSLPPRLLDIGKATLAAAIVFILLHTTFFTNIGGMYTGTIGEVAYWLAQQEVQRGGQPWYYYLFLVPLYEFLPTFIGVIGGLVYLIRRKFPAHADPPPIDPNQTKSRPPQTDRQIDSDSPAPPVYWASDGGTFAMFLIYWTFTAFVVYSWAGEKMPWLTVHMTLPLTFLAGHVIQTVLSRFKWSQAWKNGGWQLGAALLLIPAALAAMITADPFRSQSLQAMNDTLQFIAGVAVLLLLLGIIWYYGRKLGLALAARAAFVTALILMTLLTIRFAWLFNFVNFDYVNEPLVYAHASPDVKLALNQIDEISRRTVGDKMIRVAYDNDSTWPLEWYMRQYPNRVYYGENPTRDAMDSPVVIVGSANEDKVKPYLGDNYTRYRYRLVWWPVEDYKGQTLRRLWDTYVTGGPPPENPADDTVEAQEARRAAAAENRKKLWNIIFYRHYDDYDLNEWPFVHRFYVYIRNDTLNQVWDFQSGPVQAVVASAGPGGDPYANKRTEIDAVQVWGSNGTGDGQFTIPRSAAVAPDGSIYVADSGNHRIQVFDSAGNFLMKWGGEGSGPGQFSEPWGIAVGPDGTVYVADTWNHRVQLFTPTGDYISAFGSFANVQHDAQDQPGTFWGPRDIAVDAQGNVYVTDTGNKRIQKFTADGQFLQTFGGGGIIPGAFEEPVGIDIDNQGNIYVADTWNRRIQKFDSNLNPILQWDVVNAWESESVVNKPYLAVDNQNRVFISDPEGYRIIVYDGNTGDVLATWGQYGQDLASFQLPVGVAVDSQNNLLVADSDNNRIMNFAVPALAGVADGNGG